ncbi:MAG TPA: M1 family aminopeptidase, partial [Gemmatimonadaceae bacterium]|nr:M1 family aminopeptidase [Gemmatimonadaceae bacterium]
AGAQTSPRRTPIGTPDSLAVAVMREFSSGTPEGFAALDPDSAGRVFMREGRGTRQTELAQVITKTPGRAVLLLGGVVRAGSAPRSAAAGSNETNGARHFSGFYEAEQANGTWRVTRAIPLDSENFIRTQRIWVDVFPADGIQVTDTLGISVGAPWGFGVRLNNAAQLHNVLIDGKPVDHVFGGGVLWVKAPVKTSAHLVVNYSLAASRSGGRGADTASGPPAFGAYNNTDVWHPFFDYLSPNELAQMDVTVRIPADYYLTTTIPQTDTVIDGIRVIHGESLHNEFALALIFDRDWKPQTTDFGGFRFQSFTGPTFRYSHDTLAAATKRVYDLLEPRFGEPQFPSRYLAAVQDRALGPGGFSVRMNNAAISGVSGGTLGSTQSQTFAHETGHAWTMNGTGRASNFLHEAWATFVEGLMLRHAYGDDDARTYWESMRNSYMVGADRSGFAGGFEGQQSILANYDNGRIHYRKGVWILYSGNHVMGDSAFDRGMRLFIDGMGKGPSGYEQLIAAWSKAAGHSMQSFVMPWLTSKYIPNVDGRVVGSRLIVSQTQPGELFDLPNLQVELSTASGPVRTTIHLRRRADTVSIKDAGHVTDVRVDPDHDFLMQRQWGEPIVRFELPASTPAVAGATAVSLNGNFVRAPIPATKSGDAWVVELPMTEGRYTWLWQVTGGPAPAANAPNPDPSLTGVKIVKPLQRVPNAYPGR